MSFIDGFYTFSTNLTDSNRGLYQKLRIKAAKHPYESMEYLIARFMAYVHSYEEGLEFTEGLFNPKQPAIWKLDYLNDPALWIEVGVPDKKRLYHTSKNRNCRCRVYFLNQTEVEEFCHILRGASTNWVDGIEFFLFDEDFLVKTSESLPLHSKWEVTFIDDTIYITLEGIDFNTNIHQIDIWDTFQESIGNM